MQELDFSIEIANADRCRKNLQSSRSRVRGRVMVRLLLYFILQWLALSSTML